MPDGSPRTTKLYDPTSDDITLDEIERIATWNSSISAANSAILFARTCHQR